MSRVIADLGSILTQNPGRIHLIGVAGSGMSGIAALLLALGHRVSGCDRVTTLETDRLQKLGLDFHIPQTAEGVGECTAVIYSSAIRPGNPAYDAAVERGIPMFRRAEALAAILSKKQGVVVCGMHGKTTTSAMAAHVLRAGGLHPSHYVGAEIPILGTNASWDPAGSLFVAEGDESDGTLALYAPAHVIVLNIEEEHLDYYHDLAAIDAVFETLLARTTGMVFYCGDDPGATRLCKGRPGAVSFGGNPDCDYRWDNIETRAFQSVFDFSAHGNILGRVILNVPGRHNISNATGVLAFACGMGVPFPAAVDALAGFRGARRRFEEKYRDQDFLVIDDYAHHPSEIRATLDTARAGHPGRIVAMFQPHRFTRTVALREKFAGAFEGADILRVSDIYPASEPPIPGVSGGTISSAVSAHGRPSDSVFVPLLHHMRREVGRLLEPGDLLLSLGAGNIHEESTALASDLARRAELQETMGPGVIRLYEPLSKHTTLRVGGPAQFWIEPDTVEGFSRILRYCKQTGLPLMVIGRGSNLLVRDGGVHGAVVHLRRGEFSSISVSDGVIHAGVGVPLKQLSYAARDAGIGGLEWFEGIPGNVGGGLRMNAGAMGAETFNHVLDVDYLDAEGVRGTASPRDMDIRYRNVPWFKTHFAVSARFQGEPSDRATIERRLAESMSKRRSSQPAAASAGCTFKNPESVPAGKLIEELSLKNARVGGARVSEVHGNFIVNDGGATASDMLALIARIRAEAKQKRGIDLETEVQIVGEDDIT